MTNKPLTCPDCGQPLKKDGRKAKYTCENDACTVIFVRYPRYDELVEVVRQADSRTRRAP
jgi:tRNA(Ile2) C34 agmatinyltransferase TiaS